MRTPRTASLLATALVGTLALGCGSSADPSAFRPDPQRALDDVTTLASSPHEGRQGGLPGAGRAAELVVRRFQQLGLETPANSPGYLQTFPLVVWNQTIPTVLTVGEETLVEGLDYMLVMYTDPADVTGELVFAGYGLTVPPFSRAAYPGCPLTPEGFDEYAGIDVTDRTVVVVKWVPNDLAAIDSSCPVSAREALGPSDSAGSLSYKMANARGRGARAIVTVTPYFQAVQRIIMHGFDADEVSRLATLEVDRDALSLSLPSLRQWVERIDATSQLNSRMTGLPSKVETGSYRAKGYASNVIAVIPGSDPVLKDQLVVIGSHLDHMGERPGGDVYPGADDNASGTAVMMELARRGERAPARTDPDVRGLRRRGAGPHRLLPLRDEGASLPRREHQGDDQRGHGGAGTRLRPRSLRSDRRGLGVDRPGDREFERRDGHDARGEATEALPGFRPRLLRGPGEGSGGPRALDRHGRPPRLPHAS